MIKFEDQLTTGIKQEKKDVYSKTIREVVLDLRSTNKIESKTEKSLNKRKGLWARLCSRFTAMALAGFITLGGGWEKSFANQLRIKIPESQNIVPELFLEVGITDEKLKKLEDKIIKEEPEFIRWVDNYVETVKNQIDSMSKDMFQLKAEDDLRQEKEVREIIAIEKLDLSEEYLEEFFDKNRKDFQFIKSNHEQIKIIDDFIKTNLRTIVICMALLEDSKTSRMRSIDNIGFPEFNFKIHNLKYLINETASFIEFTKSAVGNKQLFQKITITPAAFRSRYGDSDIKYIDSSYLNIVIHELMHGLNPGFGDNGERSELRSFLGEGITQNITFEIVQYLSQKKPELKPQVGFIEYDQRVIVINIIDAILRTQEENKDAMSQWYAGWINDDKFISCLNKTLKNLNIDTKLAKDVRDMVKILKKPKSLIDYFQPFYGPMMRLVARLDSSGIKVSPGLLKDILTQNRTIDDLQEKGVREFIKANNFNKYLDEIRR